MHGFLRRAARTVAVRQTTCTKLAGKCLATATNSTSTVRNTFSSGPNIPSQRLPRRSSRTLRPYESFYCGQQFFSTAAGEANDGEDGAKEKFGPPFQHTGRFAAVDHSAAYEESMRGSHGKQLELANMEGLGKDDPPFDPFIEEELEEELRKLEGSNSNIQEAEFKEKKEKEEEEDEDTDDDADDFNEDELDLKSIYNNDGSLRRLKSELATLRAGAPAGGLFAIVELAGSQHKITTDDILIVNRLKPLDTFTVGSTHTLTDVMLVGSSHQTLVGMPYVAGAEVDVMVEEITKDAKVIIFKRRRRKHSKRKNGFRRDISMLRVLDIRFPASFQDHKHVERPAPAAALLNDDKQ